MYVVENRPSENGRGVIVRLTEGESVDVLPKDFSARGMVHSYGGGSASMCPDGSIVFTDANTKGVFILSPQGEVQEIIPGGGAANIRYADFSVSPTQSEYILALQQIDREGGEPVDTIAVIHTKTKSSRVIVEGADFYSHPRFSPDGKNISWMQWNHPDMPWTGSQVYVADWAEGKAMNPVRVAGESSKSAICQPRWSPDGSLWFVNDPDGFWQLYRYSLESKVVKYVRLAGYEKVELGKAEWFPGK